MRIVNVVSLLAAMAILSGCSVMAQSSSNPVALKREVADTERVFAKPMQPSIPRFSRYCLTSAIKPTATDRLYPNAHISQTPPIARTTVGFSSAFSGKLCAPSLRGVVKLAQA